MGSIGIIYTRRSGHGESASIEDQERQCRQLDEVKACARLEVIRDDAISGSNPMRPGLLALHEWLRDPAVKAVAFYHHDRLARDQEISAVLGRMLRNRPDVSVRSVSEGPVKLDSSSGRLMWGMQAAFAAYYRDLVSERMQGSYTGRRARGLWIGSRPPYGYERAEDGHLRPEPTTAATVRQIFDMAVSGARLTDIASVLNAQDAPVAPKRGGQTAGWDAAAVARRLRDRAYIGERKDGEPALWDPLVSTSLFQQASARLRGFRTTGRVKREFAWRGIARCTCGSLLWWHDKAGPTGYCGTGNRAREDRCQHRRGVRESVPNEWFGGILDYWADRGAKLESLTQTRESMSSLAVVKLADIDRRIKSLDIRLDAGTITADEFRRQLAERRRERAALAEQVAESDDSLPDIVGLPARWRAGNATDRQDILRGLFESVSVTAAGVADWKPRADRWSRVTLLVNTAMDNYADD